MRSPGAAAAVAFAVAAATLFQACHVTLTGEELCVGGGCAVVSRLTRVSPAVFNLVGTAVFGFLALASLLSRGGRRPLAAAAVQLGAAAALAAEGVLLAYQWHVAGAWCVYCLGILAAAAALNVAAGVPGLLFGLSGFGATLTVFSLLSFLPAEPKLDGGTSAVQRPGGSPALVLIYSESCPHCRNVLDAAGASARCEVRYNPVSASPALPAGLEASFSHDPRVNVAAARILGLDEIPILLAREREGLRILSGESAILSYLAAHCRERPAAHDLLLVPGGDGLQIPRGDDGCGLAPDCE